MPSLVVRFERKIDIQAAEKLIDQFSGSARLPPSISLDFSASDRIDLGAGYRIGNLLRRIRKNAQLEVVLPRGTYSSRSVPSEFFLTFTRSGLGPALARYASQIRTADTEVSAELRAYYEETLELSGHNALYVTNVHAGAVEVENEARFGRYLSGLLTKINVGARAVDRDHFQYISALCFESVQNTSDHAAKQPLPRGENIFRYLSLRFYKLVARYSGQGPISVFLKRTSERFPSSSQPSWLEILINDDGNGIAARHTLNAEIHLGHLSAEEAAVEEALAKSSIKFKAKDSKIRGGVSGEGFTNIRKALGELNAFASIRTGRCLATFDGSNSRETSFRLSRGKFGLALGSMPGTSLQILVPIQTRNIKQDSLV